MKSGHISNLVTEKSCGVGKECWGQPKLALKEKKGIRCERANDHHLRGKQRKGEQLSFHEGKGASGGKLSKCTGLTRERGKGRKCRRIRRRERGGSVRGQVPGGSDFWRHGGRKTEKRKPWKRKKY